MIRGNLPAQEKLDQTRDEMHGRCVLCGQERSSGLRLRFTLNEKQGVEASFDCIAGFQGYGGMLSGGVASSILDSAMTNCLFAHGIAAVTAEMEVRFRHPVPLGASILVQARLVKSRPPLHVIRAELAFEDKVLCESTGKFYEMPPSPQA